MHVRWFDEANSAQGNTCIIHDGMEGLARTQCLLRGQTVGSVGPVAAGMAQPKPKPGVLMLNEVKRRALPWPSKDKKQKKVFGGFLTLVECTSFPLTRSKELPL